MSEDVGDAFGGSAWQGRPKGGYWLPKELHTWPEIRAIGLGPLGVFVGLGIRASNFDTTTVPRGALRSADPAGAAPVLVKHELLEPIEGSRDYRIKTVGELRQGRGERGMVMLVSQLVPMSPEMCRAGIAAFGLWVLAASWSLATETPGYIPTEVALTLGKQKHIAALWDADVWIATEHGFLMHKRTHPIESWWALRRDDERAPIPPSLRLAVYERDGWRCVECGSIDRLSLDHIYPWSLGGSDEFGNLRTLCRSCNSRKGARV